MSNNKTVFPLILLSITLSVCTCIKNIGAVSQCSHGLLLSTYSLSCADEIHQFGKYNATLDVQWIYPCKNDDPPIDYFNFEITGKYSENLNIVVFNDRKNISQPSIGTDNYVASIKNLNASFIYDVKVTAVLKNKSTLELFSDQKVSTTDCPNEAKFDEDAFIIDSSFTIISWQKPTIGGKILHYNVEAETLTPNHYTPPDTCQDIRITDCNTKTESCTLSDLRPNYNYKLSLRAATSAGYGPTSTTTIQTLASQPGEPRDLKTQTFGDCKNNNGTLKIHWQYPCDANGKLDHFVFHLEGETNEGSIEFVHEGQIKVKKVENFEEDFTGLNNSYRYNVSLWAISSDANLAPGRPKSINGLVCSGEESLKRSVVMLIVLSTFVSNRFSLF